VGASITTFDLLLFVEEDEKGWRIRDKSPEKAILPLQKLIEALERMDGSLTATFRSTTVCGGYTMLFRNQLDPAPLGDVIRALKKFLEELEKGKTAG